MLATRLLLLSAKTAIGALVTLWGLYLMLYLAAQEVTALGSFDKGPLPDPLKDELDHLAGTIGHIAALGATPTPAVAAVVLTGAFALQASRRFTADFIEKATIKQPDPETPRPANTPVVTSALADLGFAALANASRLVSISPTLPASLDTVIAREELYARKLREDHAYFTSTRTVPNDNALMPIGPVQAILLDPVLATYSSQPRLPSHTADLRIKRVKRILDQTRPAPVMRQAGALLLAVLGVLGAITLRTADLVPLMVALPAAIVCAAAGGRTVSQLRRHGVHLALPPKPIVIPPRYPTIKLDDAVNLATLTPDLWQPAPTKYKPHAAQTPAPAKTPIAAPDVAGRRRRIAEVHAAINELDAEWLDYQLDTEAWFLTKPQLRNLNDPDIKAYRDAEATLRDLADDLTENSTDTQITAAQTAARHALKAWGTANAHALAIGVSNLSPSEEAALHTLHGLVNQLNDRSTPKAMWPQLITAITRTMDKLTTVPFTLADIADLPAIKAESRLRAITQHPHGQQP